MKECILDAFAEHVMAHCIPHFLSKLSRDSAANVSPCWARMDVVPERIEVEGEGGALRVSRGARGNLAFAAMWDCTPAHHEQMHLHPCITPGHSFMHRFSFTRRNCQEHLVKFVPWMP